MKHFIYNVPYTGPVQAVVLDWAGTAVDYGCLGPVAVFVEVFRKYDVPVRVDEARQFMGLMKKDHIRSMTRLPSVAARWREVHHREPDESDVERMYADTEPMMVAAIADHADPIPGLLETVDWFREQGIRIGSSTGYTRPMMDILVPEARKKGYAPDAVVCSSDVPAGRPFPWMCYRNAMLLGTYPMAAMVKIGDTVADIQEGRNAGIWTIGLTRSGNELGLSRTEADALEPAELQKRLTEIEARFRETGAHYVAEEIGDCPPLIDAIHERLARGENPLPKVLNG